MTWTPLVVWIMCGALMAICEKRALTFLSWQSAAVIWDVFSLATLPLFLWYYWDQIRLRDVPAVGFAWTLGASVFGLIAWFSYFAALRHFEVSRMEAFGLADVAVVCALGALVLREEITVAKVVGVALMVAGAYVLGR